MRFALTLFAVFLTVLPAVLAYGPPKPSATPTSPGWHCPDRDTQSRGKLDEFCDKPPHKGSLFGCTYDNGKGGNYVCTFDSKTGECTGGGEHCPESAYYVSERIYKRAPQPRPAPTPTATPSSAKYLAARYMLQKAHKV